MRLSDIKEQAFKVAQEFGFIIFEIDRTAHTINLRILVDQEIFIQIYANTKKEKLNIALILHGDRIYGHDKEGGTYHLHPFHNPSEHVMTNKEKSIREFVLEAMIYLEEKGFI